jgi:predicted dehydrogenase
VLGSTGNIARGDAGHLELQVYCENGRLTLNHIDGTLYVRKPDGSELRYGPLAPEDRYPMHAPSNNLVNVILGKAKNESPAHVGVRVVELLDAAYRSSEAGGMPISVSEL